MSFKAIFLKLLKELLVAFFLALITIVTCVCMWVWFTETNPVIRENGQIQCIGCD